MFKETPEMFFRDFTSTYDSMENDNAILSSAENMSNGDIWDKIRAINSLIDNFNRLPTVKSKELLIKLAKRSAYRC